MLDRSAELKYCQWSDNIGALLVEQADTLLAAAAD
jgi:hypothetical protein